MTMEFLKHTQRLHGTVTMLIIPLKFLLRTVSGRSLILLTDQFDGRTCSVRMTLNRHSSGTMNNTSARQNRRGELVLDPHFWRSVGISGSTHIQQISFAGLNIQP
jgi:hypothetical protein